tara:strand:- start:1336 stop:1749 length:414 start_codon:yes stop_codon:yes gene_type:complete
MKNFIFTIALGLLMTLGVNAQNVKGDWYIGTGDIAGIAWTDWAINPTVGYAVTDNIVVGGTVSQADSTVDMNIDFNVRYFWNGYFASVDLDGLTTDGMVVGFGKMFTFRKNVFVDPKISYDIDGGTTNLGVGFGLKF